MRSINGIIIDVDNLNCLKDAERAGSSIKYFQGTVMEISLASTAPDICRIWQEARIHLSDAYRSSNHCEEDYFVFDVGPKDVTPRRDVFTALEKQEMAGIYDEQRKTMAKSCFMDAIEAMEAAPDAKELAGIGELFDFKMTQIYKGSEFKRRELVRWLNMLGRRLLENAGRFREK
jgi:hypothetical protein